MNTTGPQQTPQLKATHEQIAALAYQLWQKDGRPSCRDQEYWFQAEKQLRSDCTPSVVHATSREARNTRGSRQNRGSNGPLRRDPSWRG